MDVVFGGCGFGGEVLGEDVFVDWPLVEMV